MKNLLFVVVAFIISYLGISWIGGLISPNDNDTATSVSSLQAAVTFGGVNYLNVFIYIILASVLTTIIFFTVKSRRSK